MENSSTAEAFDAAGNEICGDQADMLTGIDNWDDDFKEIVYKLFKDEWKGGLLAISLMTSK